MHRQSPPLSIPKKIKTLTVNSPYKLNTELSTCPFTHDSYINQLSEHSDQGQQIAYALRKAIRYGLLTSSLSTENKQCRCLQYKNDQSLLVNYHNLIIVLAIIHQKTQALHHPFNLNHQFDLSQ